jgi:hypothetical protein
MQRRDEPDLLASAEVISPPASMLSEPASIGALPIVQIFPSRFAAGIASTRSDRNAKEEVRVGTGKAGKAAAQHPTQGPDEPLRRSVQEAVPHGEELPHGADDNPISHRVRDEAKRQKLPARRSTGGD